ncbi:Homeobox domain-like [Trinorchestia longiramus]|nr:Homeobox domain-like [Trinorchestia longiramus]
MIRDNTKPKRKAVRTTIELKKELVAEFEKGTRISALATQYGTAKSTILSILKNKDVIKKANVAKGVTVLAVNRSPIIEKVEKLLLVWINEEQLAKESSVCLERINPINIISYVNKCFAIRTNYYSNCLLERIVYE